MLWKASVTSLVALSFASDISLRSCRIGCAVEWPFLKPYWCLYRMLCVSRKCTSRLQTSFSRIFENAGIMLIGL